jgi:hypothetical protein
MATTLRKKSRRSELIAPETPSIEGMQRYHKAETDKWGTVVRSLGLEGSE